MDVSVPKTEIKLNVLFKLSTVMSLERIKATEVKSRATCRGFNSAEYYKKIKRKSTRQQVKCVNLERERERHTQTEGNIYRKRGRERELERERQTQRDGDRDRESVRKIERERVCVRES